MGDWYDNTPRHHRVPADPPCRNCDALAARLAEIEAANAEIRHERDAANQTCDAALAALDGACCAKCLDMQAEVEQMREGYDISRDLAWDEHCRRHDAATRAAVLRAEAAEQLVRDRTTAIEVILDGIDVRFTEIDRVYGEGQASARRFAAAWKRCSRLWRLRARLWEDACGHIDKRADAAEARVEQLEAALRQVRQVVFDVADAANTADESLCMVRGELVFRDLQPVFVVIDEALSAAGKAGRGGGEVE